MHRIIAAVLWIVTSTLSSAADAPSLTSDKGEYRLFEKPVFTVTTRQDCFLTLVAISAEGNGVVLFPNFYTIRLKKDDRIAGGVAIKVPSPGNGFEYRLEKCGDERVFAICRDVQGGIEGIAHDFTRNRLTPVNIDSFLRWVAENKDVETEITFKVDPPRQRE